MKLSKARKSQQFNYKFVSDFSGDKTTFDCLAPSALAPSAPPEKEVSRESRSQTPFQEIQSEARKNSFHIPAMSKKKSNLSK